MHLLNLSGLPTSLVRHFLYPTSPNKPPLLPPFRSTNPCQYPSSPTLPHCLNHHQHPRFNPWLHSLLHKHQPSHGTTASQHVPQYPHRLPHSPARALYRARPAALSTSSPYSHSSRSSPPYQRQHLYAPSAPTTFPERREALLIDL
jgi:growth factor-regulated tyrosine kinase substrate